MDSIGPGLGTAFGLASAEFSVLVFFWHPLMSFIVPILVFQLLTGKAFSIHTGFFRKTRRSQFIIVLFILLFSNFVANGNAFNLVSANFSVIGTLALVYLMARASRNSDIMSLHFKKKYLLLIFIYLFALYTATFFSFLPERIPTTALLYISVVAFYSIAIALLYRSEKLDKSETDLVKLSGESFSEKDVFRFSALFILTANISCLLSSISTIIVGVTYFSMVVAGLLLFMAAFFRIIKMIRH